MPNEKTGRTFPGQISVPGDGRAKRNGKKTQKEEEVVRESSGETHSIGTRGYEERGGGVGSFIAGDPEVLPTNKSGS